MRLAFTEGSAGIPSFNVSLFITYRVPGCVLGTGGTAVNSFLKPALLGPLLEVKDNKQIRSFLVVKKKMLERKWHQGNERDCPEGLRWGRPH